MQREFDLGPQRLRDATAAAALFLVTLAVFGTAVQNGFVDIDDQLYVTANPHVQEGLSARGLWWACTTGEASNWHPLTWLSHQVDWQWFGARPAGHHAVNVMLHAANAVLAFLTLRQLTQARGPATAIYAAATTTRRRRHRERGRTAAGFFEAPAPSAAASGAPPAAGPARRDSFWPCLLAAALFALHPLRVESVAWVSERKDVLGTLFYLAATWSYAWAAQTRGGPGAWLLTTALFVLGLLAKPMLVTWPVAMLLVDFWPLRRLRFTPSGRLEIPSLWQRVREKIPWLALAAAASLVTIFVQQQGGAVLNSGAVNRWAQWALVPAAYWGYLWRSVVPWGLCFFYPIPLDALRGMPWLHLPVLVGLVALFLSSWSAWAWRLSRSWWSFGWGWFVLTLLPVVGLIKVGDQALADRYTYVPHLGLAVAAAWATRDLLEWRPRWRWPLVGFWLLAVAGLAAESAWLTTTWRDTHRLAQRALQNTRDNYVAHYLLGVADLRRGDRAAAQSHFKSAVQLNPHYYFAAQDLGVLLMESDQVDAAMELFTRLVREQPKLAAGYAGQAAVLARRGQLLQAQQAVERAARLAPHDVQYVVQWGEILAARGKFPEAAERFERAQELAPKSIPAIRRLAELRLREERFPEANRAVERALALAPNDASLHRLAAEINLRRNQSPEAVASLRRSLELDAEQPEVANQLAWILSTHADPSLRNGAEAIDWALRANQSTASRDPALLDTLAAAYAEQGRWDEAIDTATRAATLAKQAGRAQVAQELEARRELYRQHRPYRAP